MSLENVAVGDTLVCDGGHARLRVVVIDRVTKTQILIGAKKYRKSDGFALGQNKWNIDHLRQPRDDHEITEIRAEERRRILARRVAEMCEHSKLRNFTLESLGRLDILIGEITAFEKEA